MTRSELDPRGRDNREKMSWECPVCTCVNSGPTCEACESDRPAEFGGAGDSVDAVAFGGSAFPAMFDSSSLPTQWECVPAPPGCTMMNALKARFCNACGTARPAAISALLGSLKPPSDAAADSAAAAGSSVFPAHPIRYPDWETWASSANAGPVPSPDERRPTPPGLLRRLLRLAVSAVRGTPSVGAAGTDADSLLPAAAPVAAAALKKAARIAADTGVGGSDAVWVGVPAADVAVLVSEAFGVAKAASAVREDGARLLAAALSAAERGAFPRAPLAGALAAYGVGLSVSVAAAEEEEGDRNAVGGAAAARPTARGLLESILTLCDDDGGIVRMEAETACLMKVRAGAAVSAARRGEHGGGGGQVSTADADSVVSAFRPLLPPPFFELTRAARQVALAIRSDDESLVAPALTSLAAALTAAALSCAGGGWCRGPSAPPPDADGLLPLFLTPFLLESTGALCALCDALSPPVHLPRITAQTPIESSGVSASTAPPSSPPSAFVIAARLKALCSALDVVGGGARLPHPPPARLVTRSLRLLTALPSRSRATLSRCRATRRPS